MTRTCVLISVLLMLGAGPATQPGDLSLRDPEGHVHQVRAENDKATVLLFVGTQCPISNGYVPEINAIAKDFGNRSVAVLVIYSGTDVTAASAAKHVKDFSLTPTALLDPQCELARTVGATVTPEAVVLRGDGSIAYRGRIDDRVVAFGKKRQEPTTHDLRDAIEAVVAGHEPANVSTKAIGCAIVMPEGK